jgi:hypothetical protein
MACARHAIVSILDRSRAAPTQISTEEPRIQRLHPEHHMASSDTLLCLVQLPPTPCVARTAIHPSHRRPFCTTLNPLRRSHHDPSLASQAVLHNTQPLASLAPRSIPRIAGRSAQHYCATRLVCPMHAQGSAGAQQQQPEPPRYDHWLLCKTDFLRSRSVCASISTHTR